MTGEDGKWLKSPPDPRTGKPMPPKAFSATVRERGVWVTLPDDTGAVLMMLTPAGAKPVLDAGGGRSVRTWDYLAKKGRAKPGVRGRGMPGG